MLRSKTERLPERAKMKGWMNWTDDRARWEKGGRPMARLKGGALRESTPNCMKEKED